MLEIITVLSFCAVVLIMIGIGIPLLSEVINNLIAYPSKCKRTKAV